MSQTLIVIDSISDWGPYYPSDQVITFETYLNSDYNKTDTRVRVINLCNRYRYLSDGYYCSLLAEARGHNVIPSVRSLNDLGEKALYRLHLGDLSTGLEKLLKEHNRAEPVTIKTYFGITSDPVYRELARKLFERFPCPVLEVTLKYRKTWEVAGLKALSHKSLNDAEQTAFAEALDEFSRKVWRKTRARKNARYDLAMLVNPEEKLPPSCKVALKKFISAGRELGIDVELITQRDYVRLPEFDGLFIRETTAIDHHTYRFAKKAEAEGMVVVDDPNSILRCTNKIYLANLFNTHKVPAPRTRILHKGNALQIQALEDDFGYPIVIKIPDGSFSRGVVKVKDRAELNARLEELFQQSSLLLAQEFLYTDFDWRIGIFNNKPLYACRYYMVKNHWQIYQHNESKVTSGRFDTLPTFEVPKGVLDAAMRATKPIGDGLYGVDVKEKDKKGYVIEVNDNPNIDSAVEDRYLGDELYTLIMSEFLRRMEARRNKK
ncbi:MAG: RimK family protein [Hahellaceae bacterium]|nr:RimK family protein [Hahellaceae bacterium]MCP5170561.1 RimK family protein [Hahellaceae bacterium]